MQAHKIEIIFNRYSNKKESRKVELTETVESVPAEANKSNNKTAYC